MRRLLYRLTANLPCRLIDIEGEPYLERYYIGKRFGITAYLHRFVGSDGDRALHDHPWSFAFAIVLCGWYREERMRYLDINAGWMSRYRTMFPGRINILGPRAFHMIEQARPDTWTLFVHGRRVKTWGFLNRPWELSGTTVYQQPYDIKTAVKWWEHAPRDKNSGREELR